MLRTAGKIPSEGKFLKKDVYDLCFLPKLVFFNGTEHVLFGNTVTTFRTNIPRGAKTEIVIIQNVKSLSIYMGRK